jgi:RNA polymerase sigma-70 factor (ECF subfamily)
VDESESDLTSGFDQMLARAQQGDRAALGELLDRLRGMLHATTQRRMDGRLVGRIDASDIVQLTYVTALQSFSQFTGSRQGEFCAWLYTVHDRVVQRVARDHVRTQKRSVQREERKTDSHLGQLGVIVDSTASQKVVHQESLVKLTLSMDALPEDQREAVRLRYCEGWPLERIAREMNRTMPSVAGLLKRGLKTLRARLANDI